MGLSIRLSFWCEAGDEAGFGCIGNIERCVPCQWSGFCNEHLWQVPPRTT